MKLYCKDCKNVRRHREKSYNSDNSWIWCKGDCGCIGDNNVDGVCKYYQRKWWKLWRNK